MANADVLHKAKDAKKDEFYTQLEDINAELVHYELQFKGKIVLMNCDDPTWSNFWRYFHMEFERLGLKKIISTHYEAGETASYMMTYEGGDDENFEAGVRTDLTQNGDFRSPECIELLKEADIVVTNPPFSLFRPYLSLLIEYDKKFIIWGNNNAITYKEVFPLLKENKIWLGYMCNKTCVFRVKDGYEYDVKLSDKINDGNKYGKVPAISVFTNLDIKKRYDKIDTTYYYSKKDTLYPELYPKYDNYDAINVASLNEIPMDYNDVMGVPITFMNIYNPDQFEIVGMLIDYVGKYFIQGSPTYTDVKHKNSTCAVLNGKRQYAKILIKRKDGN